MGITMLNMEYFADKTLNCLGDSTTRGDNGVDGGSQGISWVSHVREYLPFRQVRNYGVCGSRIAVSSERDDSFVERYEQMDLEADDVIVFGGVNDFQHDIPLGDLDSRDVRTFSGALNTVLTGLQGLYPRANIVALTATPNDFVHPTKQYPTTHQPNSLGLKQVDYVERMKAIGASYCIPVVDLFRLSGISPFAPGHEEYMPDGLHYSQAGYARLCKRIIGLTLPYLI
ncbi:hypothetical protein KIM372_15330 [Bombiscardovia nodaiensis]|uniref:SGNH hydrolase-type esterase domain-containing protein n=1 Tax=Bombiscardovia nodaiensis TaxID=2932181 RepID=A0ABM8B9P9_9BIFI|nr:hypothetical protein KIM372_15330 [Bombiscardovia nodaiensis]